MTDQELLERIQSFVADAADKPVDQVGTDDDIYETLTVDSLGAVMIFVYMADQLGVPEPGSDFDFKALNTARKIFDYARPLMGSAPQHRQQPVASALPSPEEVAQMLPYGDAFRMVDEVVSVHASGAIVTLKYHALDAPVIAAHFRNGPAIVPGVLLSEQVAQSALLLGLMNGRLRSDQIGLLSELRCQFIAPAEAPCVVRVELRASSNDACHSFSGVAQVNGSVVAQVEGRVVAAPASRMPGGDT